MLLWINGPFGGGKTQTAHELVRRLPDAVLCDPEHLGFGLHRMLPRSIRGDFQDLRAWREGVVEVLQLVLRHHDGPVVVPMTVVDPQYFDETVGRLRRLGHDVRHFALLAQRDVVVRRLRERGPGHALAAAFGTGTERRESFALRRLDDCLQQLREPRFAQHLYTDTTDIGQVAEQIAASAGLELRADTDGALRRRVRRSLVGLRHIRL